MARRLLWTQGEVAQMGKLLGFKNFDRRSIRYWIEVGVFPKPDREVEGIVSYYKDKDIDSGFLEIGKRMRIPTLVTLEDIKLAKEEVLETVRAKNMTLFIEKMKE